MSTGITEKLDRAIEEVKTNVDRSTVAFASKTEITKRISEIDREDEVLAQKERTAVGRQADAQERVSSVRAQYNAARAERVRVAGDGGDTRAITKQLRDLRDAVELAEDEASALTTSTQRLQAEIAARREELRAEREELLREAARAALREVARRYNAAAAIFADVVKQLHASRDKCRDANRVLQADNASDVNEWTGALVSIPRVYILGEESTPHSAMEAARKSFFRVPNF